MDNLIMRMGEGVLDNYLDPRPNQSDEKLHPRIYWFYSEHGEIVYVGKTIDFKRRIVSYFKGYESNRLIVQNFGKAYKIRFLEIGNWDENSLSEFEEFMISYLRPRFNVAVYDKDVPNTLKDVFDAMIIPSFSLAMIRTHEKLTKLLKPVEECP